MTPACSILLPVRDALATLGKCATSIRAQTLTDFEVVAINDGSADGSARALRKLAASDPRWRVIDNPGHGIVDALNVGLERCRAPLVARMDADDVMHPARLAAQVAAMAAAPDVAVLGTRVSLIDSEVTASGFREYIRWQNRCVSAQQIANQRYVESPFAHPSVMFRRLVVLDAGGYGHGDYPEDYELWLRLLESGKRMEKLPRTLIGWRDGAARVSRTDPRCSRDAFDRLRARYLARDPRICRARDGLVIWGAGRRTRARCAHLLDQGFRVRAWVDIDPKKIGNVIDGARVLPPTGLASIRAPFILSYVTNHGARPRIARALREQGLVEGVDWLSVG